jgi:hypothetical protein
MLEGLCGLPVNDTEGYRELQVDQQSSEDSIFLVMDEHVAGRPCGVDYLERVRLRIESNTLAAIFAEQHRLAVLEVQLCFRRVLALGKCSEYVFVVDDVSIALAKKFAPAPSANWPGDTGDSMEPAGLDGDTVPVRDVGEY